MINLRIQPFATLNKVIKKHEIAPKQGKYGMTLGMGLEVVKAEFIEDTAFIQARSSCLSFTFTAKQVSNHEILVTRYYGQEMETTEYRYKLVDDVYVCQD
jgi:hypothetical protein